MNKNIYQLILVVAVLLVPNCYVHSQGLRLKEIVSDMDMNYAYFHYNDQNLVDSMYQEEFNPNGYVEYTYRLLQYDEKGCMTQELKYLKYDESYYLSDKTFYTYDDKDRLSTILSFHTNDNECLPEELPLSAAIMYTYDDDDRIICEQSYSCSDFCGMSVDTDYIYDVNGLLLYKESQDTKTEFTYDDRGHVISEMEYVKNKNDKFVESLRTDYKYDKNDNLVQRFIIDLDDNIKLQKFVITHNKDIPADYVQFPICLSDVDNYYSLADNDLFTLSKNAVNTVTVHTMHWWEGDMGKDHTATFLYEEHIGSGIQNVSMIKDIPSIDCTNGIVTVNGFNKPVRLFIYDLNGNLLNSVLITGKTDINYLPSGAYLLTVGNVFKKITK